MILPLRPSWSSLFSNVCLEDSLRVLVWYGLDQLREVVEMFSPLLDCLILPSQLHHISQLDQLNTEGGLFRSEQPRVSLNNLANFSLSLTGAGKG